VSSRRPFSVTAGVVLLVAAIGSGTAAAPVPSPSPTLPAENPLHAADEASRERAIADAWVTFQRACRPCHGSLGAGDGPYATAYAVRVGDLRIPLRESASDAARFRRIRDGAAGLSSRPWQSSMPAFGPALDDAQIWGLVALLEQLGRENGGLDPAATPAQVYAARCAVCHGADGKGDGPLAAELSPAPRDLVRAQYRLRSTAAGSPPLDNDILGVLFHGVGTSSMGRFAAFGPSNSEDIVAFLKTLAPARFAATPVAIDRGTMPMEPPAQLVARGKELYEKYKCDECHGRDGRGDGPKGIGLKDDSGRPSFPSDFTKVWQLRAGGGVNDVFTSLASGFDGTPMQGYADAIPIDERWAIAYYVDHFSRLRARLPARVPAMSGDDPLPVDPDAPPWSVILKASVPLGPQVVVAPYWTEPSVDTMDVAIVASAKQVGFVLTWDDRTRDVVHDDAATAVDLPTAIARRGAWRLPDQVAIQLPLADSPKGELPPLYLGDAERPVVRWVWSADRMDERGENGVVVERVAGPASAPEPQPATMVRAKATYADGRWKLVMVGDRPTGKANDRTGAGSLQALALQAWDGAAGEKGHWQSLSGWIPIALP